jgi:hypothetical protein
MGDEENLKNNLTIINQMIRNTQDLISEHKVYLRALKEQRKKYKENKLLDSPKSSCEGDSVKEFLTDSEPLEDERLNEILGQHN